MDLVKLHPNACQQCRRNKFECDRVLPKCNRCRLSYSGCQYLLAQSTQQEPPADLAPEAATTTLNSPQPVVGPNEHARPVTVPAPPPAQTLHQAPIPAYTVSARSGVRRAHVRFAEERRTESPQRSERPDTPQQSDVPSAPETASASSPESGDVTDVQMEDAPAVSHPDGEADHASQLADVLPVSPTSSEGTIAVPDTPIPSPLTPIAESVGQFHVDTIAHAEAVMEVRGRPASPTRSSSMQPAEPARHSSRQSDRPARPSSTQPTRPARTSLTQPARSARTSSTQPTGPPGLASTQLTGPDMPSLMQRMLLPAQSTANTSSSSGTSSISALGALEAEVLNHWRTHDLQPLMLDSSRVDAWRRTYPTAPLQAIGIYPGIIALSALHMYSSRARGPEVLVLARHYLNNPRNFGTPGPQVNAFTAMEIASLAATLILADRAISYQEVRRPDVIGDLLSMKLRLDILRNQVEGFAMAHRHDLMTPFVGLRGSFSHVRATLDNRFPALSGLRAIARSKTDAAERASCQQILEDTFLCVWLVMDGGHSADSLRLLVTWLTLWDQTFINMLMKKKRDGSPAPDSFVLVMLSYYAIMLHMMSSFWWINGLARVVMSQAETMLDEQWRPFIAKPKSIVLKGAVPGILMR